MTLLTRCASYLAVNSRPAALAKLVETRVAFSSGVLALALRAVLLALPLSEQLGVVLVVETPGFVRPPMALVGGGRGRGGGGRLQSCRGLTRRYDGDAQ